MSNHEHQHLNGRDCPVEGCTTYQSSISDGSTQLTASNSLETISTPGLDSIQHAKDQLRSLVIPGERDFDGQLEYALAKVRLGEWTEPEARRYLGTDQSPPGLPGTLPKRESKTVEVPTTVAVVAAPPKVVEIWRCAYIQNAYQDQTGKSQWGTVVYEQLLVTETGECFDVDDGYKVHPNFGRFAVSEDGRRFKLWTETVDYTGGLHVREILTPNRREATATPGIWREAPKQPQGYCHPDGSGPVRSLFGSN